MDREEKLELFFDELQLIQNEELKDYTKEFLLNKVPDYFFTVPASSTGKYHPSFASGEGGLVRHTQMVVAVLIQLLVVEKYDPMSRDCMIAACILHDTFKHGHTEYEWTIESHPVIAADEWMKFVGESNAQRDLFRLVYYCILKHMGQWSPETVKCVDPGSFKSCCSLVHLADYIASRKFFDMFGDNNG